MSSNPNDKQSLDYIIDVGLSAINLHTFGFGDAISLAKKFSIICKFGWFNPLRYAEFVVILFVKEAITCFFSHTIFSDTNSSILVLLPKILRNRKKSIFSTF